MYWSSLYHPSLEYLRHWLGVKDEDWSGLPTDAQSWYDLLFYLKSLPQTSFHDLTMQSHALLTNVAEGGLKQDLSAGLGDSASFSTYLEGLPLYDASTLEGYDAVSLYAPVPQGTPWDMVRAYYKLYEGVSSDALGDGVNARAAVAGDASLKTPMDAQVAGGWHNPHDLTLTQQTMVTANQRPQSMRLMPTLLRYQMDYALQAHTKDGASYYLSLNMRPHVVLHNPYNVWLRNVAMRISMPLNHQLKVSVSTYNTATYQHEEAFALEDSAWKNSLLVDALAWGMSAEQDAWETAEEASAIQWDIRGDFPPGAVLYYSLGNHVDWGSLDTPEEPSGQAYGAIALSNTASADRYLRLHRLERLGGDEPLSKSDARWEYFPRLGVAGSAARAMDQAQVELTFDGAASRSLEHGGGVTTLCIEDLNTLNLSGEPVADVWTEGISIAAAAGSTAQSARLPLSVLSRRPTMIGSFLYERKSADQGFSGSLLRNSARGSLMNAQSAKQLNDSSWQSIGYAKGDARPVNTELVDGRAFTYAGDIYAASDVFGNVGSQRVTLLDVPRAPLYSLGQLQHAPVQTAQGQPAYVIGNSFRPSFGGSPVDSPDTLLATVATTHPQSTLSQAFEVDIAYAMNETLFDRYFFSTVPLPTRAHAVAPPSSGWADYTLYDTLDFSKHYLNAGAAPYDAFTQTSIDSDLPLPNTQYAYGKASSWQPQVGDYTDSHIAHLRGFKTAAANLMVKGGLNVNTTSQVAWAMVLSAWRLDNRLNAEGVSTALANVVTGGRYAVSGVADGVRSQVSWNTNRSLSDDEVWQLAGEIVEQVKRRGPFLSMGEFVNRMRVNASGSGADTRNVGALQAAIDAAGLNDAIPAGGEMRPDYLTQADLLTHLAPIANVRSDTFRIRAYGESVNPITGETRAQAWCEAIVQRIVEPVDWDGTLHDALSPSSPLGRRFKIIAWRWLTPGDV